MSTTTTVNHHVGSATPVRAFIQDHGTPVIQFGDSITVFLNRYPDTLADSADFVRRLLVVAADLLEQIELVSGHQPSEVCS